MLLGRLVSDAGAGSTDEGRPGAEGHVTSCALDEHRKAEGTVGRRRYCR